jgi:putative oxidoreductase
MEGVLGRYSPYLYALMRIAFGLMFMQHGAQKLFGLLTDRGPQPLMSLVGLAGVIEFFGGLLIVIGLFTSLVTFLCSGEMAVAYFLRHAPQGFFPIQNGGELAVLYCFAFLYMASRGSGPLSVDAMMGRNKT